MTQTLDSAPAAPAAGPRRRPNRWAHRLVPVVSILLGVVLLLYPVAGQYYADFAQWRFSQQYSDDVAATGPDALQRELDHARAYNAALPATSLTDPWTGTDTTTDPGYAAYLAELDLFDAMARVRVPTIGVDLPVLHGTSEDTLARGIGHLYGSSLPVGGAGSHAVVTGHSAYAEATLFDRLPDLRVGELVYLEVYGQTLAYRVDRTSVVLPTELDQLARSGADEITLITCTPRAVNSHRLLVHAVRVPYDAAADPATHTGRGMDWSLRAWMYPRVIAAAVALALLTVMIGRWVAADRRRARRQPRSLT